MEGRKGRERGGGGQEGEGTGAGREGCAFVVWGGGGGCFFS